MSFEFYIDRKVTVWERDKYIIDANSPVDAEMIIRKEFEDPEYDTEIFDETETIHDTQEDMSIEDNGGSYTKELIRVDSDGEICTIKYNTNETP